MAGDAHTGPHYRPEGSAGSDLVLLRAHASGRDPEAFALLVQRHRDRCWSVAFRMLANPEDAADVVQETFLKAHRSAGSFRGESSVGTWLHRIVVNASLDRLRSRGALRLVPLDEEHDDPPELGADPALRLDVEAALRALPVDQRVVLVLGVIEDRPIKEIAAALGVPEGTVKSRAARGRAALAHVLGDAGGNLVGGARVHTLVSTPDPGLVEDPPATTPAGETR